jgi:hypothetical protein
MKKTIAVFAVIAAAAMLMAPVGSSAAPAMNGTEGGSGTVSKADRTFLVEAMQTDLMEVKSGEVAMKQGKSQSVVKRNAFTRPFGPLRQRQKTGEQTWGAGTEVAERRDDGEDEGAGRDERRRL